MSSILSWNVLLRKFEIKHNPNSNILKDWTNEADREDATIELLKQHLQPNTIALLQEVSESLLVKIKTTFFDRKIFSQGVRSDENLVTIAPEEFTNELWKQHPNSANAYLSITNSVYRIVNTHLKPQKYAKCNVMKHLMSFPTDKRTFIAGDFNAKWKFVNEALGSRYMVPPFGITYKKSAIDQIVFDEKKLKYSIVKIITQLSDHHAVKLHIE